MENSAVFLRRSEEGILIDIHVQPRASRNALAGVHQERLKIRLTAPPVEGEANKECLRFVAKLLNVPQSQLELVQGHKSRQKTILVRRLDLRTVQEALQPGGAP